MADDDVYVGDDRFTNFLIAVVSALAIGVVGWLLYLVVFVGPNNNGDRDVQRNHDRLEACGSPESASPSEVAVCVKALEAD